MLCSSLLLSACASAPKSILSPPRRAGRQERAQRIHDTFDNRIKSIRRIGILPPDVRAYQVVNGVWEKMDEWIETGGTGASEALSGLARSHSDRFRPITPDDSVRAEYEDMMALHDAVVRSILKHTAKDKDLFYERFKTLDYSVGSVSRILDRYQVDALLVTWVSGVIIKNTLQPSLRGGTVMVSLINRSGALLCYGDSERFFGMDPRSAEAVKSMTSRALKNLPEEVF